MLVAAETAVPEWATWLGVPIWLGGAALLLWLLLSRKVKTSGECDEAIAVAVEAERAIKTAEHAQMEHRVVELLNRNAALIADRDAWREAHREETNARRAAEEAAGKLMESGNLSLALLEALRQALGQPHDSGRGDT